MTVNFTFAIEHYFYQHILLYKHADMSWPQSISNLPPTEVLTLFVSMHTSATEFLNTNKDFLLALRLQYNILLPAELK